MNPANRWIARAAGLVSALLVHPALAQPPAAAPPAPVADNTDHVVQAVERLDAAAERWRRACAKPDAHG